MSVPTISHGLPGILKGKKMIWTVYVWIPCIWGIFIYLHQYFVPCCANIQIFMPGVLSESPVIPTTKQAFQSFVPSIQPTSHNIPLGVLGKGHSLHLPLVWSSFNALDFNWTGIKFHLPFISTPCNITNSPLYIQDDCMTCSMAVLPNSNPCIACIQLLYMCKLCCILLYFLYHHTCSDVYCYISGVYAQV